MDKLKATTTSYKVTEIKGAKELMVDIVNTGKVYEAWIYSKYDGFKGFMFGIAKEDINEPDFVSLVESNLSGKSLVTIIRQYLTP